MVNAGRQHQDRPNGARVTISDVSRELGLSKSTVSRALNHYPDIALGTRRRVEQTAQRMGYRPLAQAQAIRTGLTKSLGLVIQMADHDAQRPFLAEFLAGVSQGASAHGWTLTLAATDGPDHTEETFRSLIADRKVDGFILPRPMIDDPRIALLNEEDVPFVLFGRHEDPGSAWFDILGEDAMSDAVDRLVALGHRRIAFINGGRQYTYAKLRQTGFLSGMARHGLSVDDPIMSQDAVTIQEGAEAGRVLLASKAPPTAIVCAVDMAALGVYQAAAEQGLRIGADLSVISYDGIPDATHAKPPLSTYAVDFTESGARLSQLLIRRIKGEPVQDLRETARASFLDRASVGTGPARPHEP